ncbi:hypothetical protein Ahy_B08g090952 isoform L [Arachis hypogaea]|uniref:Uncharacterized protein n=1 Tax=Arachis hypogaea TaxID=3818 RepID=A0A444Y116_ARAHY|nr:hypothetical protein Ahy_B08g090952 isoform L [Arachis hypogaea]
MLHYTSPKAALLIGHRCHHFVVHVATMPGKSSAPLLSQETHFTFVACYMPLLVTWGLRRRVCDADPFILACNTPHLDEVLGVSILGLQPPLGWTCLHFKGNIKKQRNLTTLHSFITITVTVGFIGPWLPNWSSAPKIIDLP